MVTNTMKQERNQHSKEQLVPLQVQPWNPSKSSSEENYNKPKRCVYPIKIVEE